MMERPLTYSLALVCSLSSAYCAEPYYLQHAGDVKSPAVLAPESLEVSLQYGKMNDMLDFFNIRDSELGSSQQAIDIGDYSHLKLGVGYAPFVDTMLQGQISKRTVDYGKDSIDVLSYDLSARYLLKPPTLTSPTSVSMDVGIKGNEGKKLSVTSAEDISYYLNKIGSSIEVSETEDYLWFTKTLTDSTVSVGLPKDQNPEISIDSMSDRTLYGRIGFGVAMERFFPSLYIEGGHTEISTKIDTNMDDIAGETFQDLFSTYTDFPIDLGRNEKYGALGLELSFVGPWDTLFHAAYEYKRIFRSSSKLDYMKDNHTLRADVSYNVTPNLSVSLGGVYLQHQLNGDIPFLYNQYTQTTFDHRYGWAEVGIRYLF